MDKSLHDYTEAFEDIPGTRVFTTKRARQGYHLNQLVSPSYRLFRQ